jgi:hypothetical protein
MRLHLDERGALPAFIGVIILVIVMPLFWIVFNEVVLHVQSFATADSGGITDILISIWRLTPIILLMFGVIWAIVQAHRSGLVG